MQNVHDPILNLCGEKIALGPLRSDLVPLYHRWMNRFEASRTGQMQVLPSTPESAGDYYSGMSRSRHDSEFTIFLPLDGDIQSAHQWRPIGNAGLHDINHTNRTAEFGIMIGEQDCWNKGYGTETARLLLDYGFNIAALHNIMLTCFASNAAGLKAYERAGFKRIGVMHDCRWVDGQQDDLVLMDCLAADFGPSAVLDQLQVARGQTR